MKKTSFAIVACLLFSYYSNAQDYLAFSALKSQGYGAYAHNFGHNIPLPICGLTIAYYNLVSADAAPVGEFPGTKAALKLNDGGTGFTNFTTELNNRGYTLDDVEMKFTSMSLGPDIQNQDWFVVGVTETRFYQNGVYTFYVDGYPIITGTMPILKLEIDYNNTSNCYDDVISTITQYTAVSDASTDQSTAIQAIAAAFLTDVGNKEIRFVFSQMQPAAQGATGAIFESAIGKIELGTTYDDVSATNISQPTPDNCTTPSTTVTSTGSGNWLHVLDGTDRVVSILDSENMGSITTEFYVNSGTVRSAGTLEYMDRNFTITPATQPSNPIRVKLYFTATEWEDFTAANPDGLEAMSHITITKFESSDCDAINNAAGEITVPLLDYGYIPSDNSYFMNIEVTSFSTFFIHGPKSQDILPVELTSFKGTATKDGVVLNWTTASELNNAGFEVQRSIDAMEWSKIGWIAGKETTSITQSYLFKDKQTPSQSTIYYRLKQIDLDEQFEYSSVISVQLPDQKKKVSEFYPNPGSSADIWLDYDSNKSEELNIAIYNLSGQLTLETIKSVSEGSNQLNFDFSFLKKGIYWVNINGANGSIHRKLIIEK